LALSAAAVPSVPSGSSSLGCHSIPSIDNIPLYPHLTLTWSRNMIHSSSPWTTHHNRHQLQLQTHRQQRLQPRAQAQTQCDIDLNKTTKPIKTNKTPNHQLH
jgi:hypothetical protein